MKVTKVLQPDEQLVHITDEFVDVTTLNDKGVGSRGKVTHDEFLKLLTASTVAIKTQNMDLYELGPNIVKFRHNEQGFVYYFLSRKGKYPFNNHGKRINIHYPNMLFKFLINDKRELRSTEVYIVKDEDVIISKSWGVESVKILPDTQLYQYPWGNVRVDGSLCWGGNSFPILDNYSSINELVSSFYEAPTNSDYTNGVFNNTKTRPELLKKFKSEIFDESLLAASKKLYCDI